MKSTLAAALLAAAATTVSAHSWLECTNHDNAEMLGWMKGNSTLNPPVIIDPAMPWYSQYCHGWPRNKANPGNWIDESTNYVWNIAANSWNGGSYHPADTHACPPGQRSPTYQANAPMSSAAPGGMIRLRYGGNGHTRGFNVGGTPGTVTVYWKGGPEREITDISEFTSANALQSTGFADKAFAYPADPNVKTPDQGLVDKGNWMELNIPKDAAPGRHMFVWVWYYKDAPQWSTCFDVMVQGGASGSSSSSSSPSSSSSSSSGAAAAPAAPAAPASSPASVPAAAAAAPAPAASSAAASTKGGKPPTKAAVVTESDAGAAELAADDTAPAAAAAASSAPAAEAAPAAPAPAAAAAAAPAAPAVPSPAAPAAPPKSTVVNEAPDNSRSPYANWWRWHPRKFSA